MKNKSRLPCCALLGKMKFISKTINAHLRYSSELLNLKPRRFNCSNHQKELDMQKTYQSHITVSKLYPCYAMTSKFYPYKQ